MINIINADSAKTITMKARIPKTHLDRVIETISKEIKSAASHGAGRVTIETGCLERADYKYLSNILIARGYRIRWHDIGDYDDERICITWDD